MLYEAASYRGANNCAYYAIFHAISAVLAMEVTVQQIETAEQLICMVSE
ncbi:MAG: hypothetical protein IJZ34_18530 [Lachnospiraceae bacterium]|nr:hypothetical protein [Lachnospiraceae bacterium]